MLEEIKFEYKITAIDLSKDEQFKDFANSVKTSIENESKMNDLKKIIEKQKDELSEFEDKIDSDDYPKAPLHSYNNIATNLEDSTVDTISIEDAHRHNDLKLLEFFKTKKIIFGLIKIASSEIENIDEIRSRVFDCLNHIDKERLIAAPDCGMGYLSREMAMQKLENLNKAVKSI